MNKAIKIVTIVIAAILFSSMLSVPARCGEKLKSMGGGDKTWLPSTLNRPPATRRSYMYMCHGSADKRDAPRSAPDLSGLRAAHRRKASNNPSISEVIARLQAEEPKKENRTTSPATDSSSQDEQANPPGTALKGFPSLSGMIVDPKKAKITALRGLTREIHALEPSKKSETVHGKSKEWLDAGVIAVFIGGGEGYEMVSHSPLLTKELNLYHIDKDSKVHFYEGNFIGIWLELALIPEAASVSINDIPSVRVPLEAKFKKIQDSRGVLSRNGLYAYANANRILPGGIITVYHAIADRDRKTKEFLDIKAQRIVYGLNGKPMPFNQFIEISLKKHDLTFLIPKIELIARNNFGLRPKSSIPIVAVVPFVPEIGSHLNFYHFNPEAVATGKPDFLRGDGRVFQHRPGRFILKAEVPIGASGTAIEGADDNSMLSAYGKMIKRTRMVAQAEGQNPISIPVCMFADAHAIRELLRKASTEFASDKK